MKLGKSSKSWREKLEKDIQPRIVGVPEKWAKTIGNGKMLIPTPLLVDAVVRKIRKGKLVTVNAIREKLAKDFNATITCPLTTGIFLNIAANTAEEDRLKGKKIITPYWRVVKEGGILNPAFPGGVMQQAAYLKQEGIPVEKGKKKDEMKVAAFEDYLLALV